MLIFWAVLGGFLLDALFGDPAWLPHPVVLMGRCISALEKRLRTALPKTPRGELRKTDADCLLVFTTTSTDHALEGFQVRALHYLVKPFSEEELSALLAEMLARLPRPEPVLTVKVSGSDVRLCYRDIISAEHFAHLINIRTTALKTLVTRQSFKVFTEPLKKDPRFFVCGRGMIVNLEHAADFRDGAFCMTDGSSVYVSQELLKPARQAFMEFLLQRERMK